MGLGVSYVVRQFLQWPTAVTAESVALSSAVAAVTGMFFGCYPARKAASLHPIDALRHE
jgi:putative ABC transport system permease protein